MSSLPATINRQQNPHSSQELLGLEPSALASVDSWSHLDDDDLQNFYYPALNRRNRDRDTISQMSMDSTDSREPVFIAAGDIR